MKLCDKHQQHIDDAHIDCIACEVDHRTKRLQAVLKELEGLRAERVLSPSRAEAVRAVNVWRKDIPVESAEAIDARRILDAFIINATPADTPEGWRRAQPNPTDITRPIGSVVTEFADDAGDPTEETLERIANWPPTEGFDALMDFVRERWAYANDGYWEGDGEGYRIHTAGWSGNEALIGALRQNRAFWLLCWVSSNRGGTHAFRLPQCTLT